jgi:trehalose 6-phosphate synthase
VNLVVVSNRVARATANEPMTGGLAAALLPVVEKSGAIWVGSSGRVRHGAQKEPFAEIEALGAGALAMLDLPAAHYGGYYEGFANSALWPALHSRSDLIRSSQDDYQSYREVNAFMARALLRFRKPETVFWVQDYHFLALGAELRDLGVRHPIGFFLHTPWPTRAIIGGVPHHRELVEAMLAYDLIGFQTDDDRDNFVGYLRSELGLRVEGEVTTSRYGKSRCAVFPIGIDPEKFAMQAARAASHPDVSRLRRSLNGEKLAIGVDRVDYSKGLVNRIEAFDRMLTLQPHLKRTASLLQIATLSRGTIEAYGNLQNELAKLVSEVNGRHGEVDWTPIRYLNKGFSQTVLAGLYRTAQVGIVTPLHDGMNLVAKEYVAAQNPADPGVLVLSKFAGAANELDTALLVNPHDIDGMARSIATAFSMPLIERRMRWETMMTKLRAGTIQQWFADFLDALQDAHGAVRTPETDKPALDPDPPPVWPLRWVGSTGSRLQ